MPRVKGWANAHKRKKKILQLAKGYRGARGRLIRSATEAVEKSLCYAFRDRKVRKREFRKLWIVRINAAAQSHGLSYSKLMNLLRINHVNLNRKVLSDIATTDPQSFEHLITQLKSPDSATP